MRPEAIVLVGVPGCGKSTYASMFKKFYGYEIVERDQIRLEMQKEYGKQPLTDTRVDFTKWDFGWPHEENVTSKQYKLIKNLSNQLKSVVVSDTNLKVKYRESLIRLLQRQGYKVKVQYLYTPLHVCIDRNKNREYPVDDSVIICLHRDYLIRHLYRESPLEKEAHIIVCHSCEETNHLAKLIPQKYFVMRYRYNNIVWDLYRKQKEVVDVILNSNK